jgi:hypothetical protein
MEDEQEESAEEVLEGLEDDELSRADEPPVLTEARSSR